MFRSQNWVVIKAVFQLLLYQSIALKELYIFGVGVEVIRLVVGPQSSLERGETCATASRFLCFWGDFPIERFTQSSWTQKMFCRALQELSNDV